MSIIKANRWETTSGVLRSTILQTVTVMSNTNYTYTMSDIGGAGSSYGDSEAGVDISPLSITITPQFANSKILITYNTLWGISGGNYVVIRVKRGIAPSGPSYNSSAAWMNTMNGFPGTNTFRGTASITGYSGSHSPVNNTFCIVDTPNTTAAITYLPNVKGEADNSATFYLNRIHYNNNDYGMTSGISTVTAMEIAQ